MKKVWIGLASIALVYACSDSVGSMLEDAGTMLQDSGAEAMDAGGTGAAGTGAGGTGTGGTGDTPKTQVSITCNQSYTRTPPGGETSTTKYELVDTAGKGFPDVSVRQVFGSQQSPYLNCREGWTCSGMPSGKMVVEWHLSTFIDGKAFVQTCPGPDPSNPNAPESVTLFY